MRFTRLPLFASMRNNYTNQLRSRERERGIKTKMKVKLAAKMLVIAWILMKKKKSFNLASEYVD